MEPEIGHCPCPKYGVTYWPDLYNFQIKKKHLKNDLDLKFTFQNMLLLNNL